jgi:hypothetical protein
MAPGKLVQHISSCARRERLTSGGAVLFLSGVQVGVGEVVGVQVEEEVRSQQHAVPSCTTP